MGCAMLLFSGIAAAEDGLGVERSLSDMIPDSRLFDAKQQAAKSGVKADVPANWAVLPEAGYSPDQGANGGVKFTGRGLTDLDMTLDLEASAAMQGQRGVDVTLLTPGFFTRRLVNVEQAHDSYAPTKNFFGLGNNHVGTEPLSTHSVQRQRALITFGYWVMPDLIMEVTGGYRNTKIGRGKLENGVGSTLDVFPALPGLEGGRTNPLSLSFIYNNRESITRPTKGWSLIGTVEHVNINLANDFQFTRYVLDASYLHPMSSGKQVFGLRIGGEIIQGRTREIPFFELASLGGSDDLRGFFPDRFLGRSRMMINGEYRIKLLTFSIYSRKVDVDAVLFADMGRVFLSDGEISDQFKYHSPKSKFVPLLFSDFRYDGGPGVRFAIGEAILARIDMGFSDEEKGLVYLVFGHTF